MKKILIGLMAIGLLTITACSDKPVDQVDSKETPQLFNQLEMPEKGEEIAVITTNKGVMKIHFFEKKAPETVKSFKTLAKDKKYDANIFHRVIEDFMIQGGDFENNNGTGGHSYKGPGTTLPDELDPELKHVRGAVSMANKGAGTQTAGSQFFIVHPEDGAGFLDGGYAIYGQVFDGLEVIDAIAGVETDGMDKPLEDIIMEKVEIVEFE